MTKDEKICVRNIDRDLWIDFSSICRKKRKTVGEVLQVLIREYLEKEGRENDSSIK